MQQSEEHPKKLSITAFDYALPEDRIAHHPLPERDASKLLFYKSGVIEDLTFQKLPELLPAKSLLIFNNTKVVQARIVFHRATGARIELFCLEPIKPHHLFEVAFHVKSPCTWICMVGNAKKWKGETLEKTFTYQGTECKLRAIPEGRSGEHQLVRFEWEPATLLFEELLAMAGELPLPPYMQRKAEANDHERYQTVYAERQGSVAAPTAGLHFTDEVLGQLKEQSISTGYLTLHVGAGTFKPVTANQLEDHEMHHEQFAVTKDLLLRLQKAAQPNIAVGTTSARTLESIYWLGCKMHNWTVGDELIVGQWAPYDEAIPNLPLAEAIQNLLNYLDARSDEKLIARTGLMIAPGYTFKLVDGLITNFHMPQSTLLLLIAALIGPDWERMYEHALNNDYRFLSYGDSSLLLP